MISEITSFNPEQALPAINTLIRRINAQNAGPPRLGQVATRSSIPTAINAGQTTAMYRSLHYARDTITQLQIGLPGWYLNGSGNIESPFSAPATWAASVEYPLGVAVTPFTFSGAFSGVAAPGGNVWSDTLPISIPDGAPFAIRSWISCAGNVPYRNQCGTGFLDGLVIGGTDHTQDLTTVNTNSGTYFSPLAILGLTNRESFIVYGDSIAAGNPDTIDDDSYDLGSICRSVGPVAAYIDASKFGDLCTNWVASNTNRIALAQYATRAICELGHNDLGTRTAAQLEADWLTMWNLIRAVPSIDRLFQTTITMRTTSSDAWATVANQTTDATRSPRIITANKFLRARPAPLDGVLDISSTVESSINSGKFAVDVNVGAITPDGIHFNEVGNNRIKSSGVMNRGVLLA